VQLNVVKNIGIRTNEERWKTIGFPAKQGKQLDPNKCVSDGKMMGGPQVRNEEKKKIRKSEPSSRLYTNRTAPNVWQAATIKSVARLRSQVAVNVARAPEFAPDAVGEGVEPDEARLPEEVGELELDPDPDPDALMEVEVGAAAIRPFPIDVKVLHEDDAGTGWAAGVAASP